MIELKTLDMFDYLDELNEKNIKPDLILCDLPYNVSECSWDCEIDLELFWKKLNPIISDNTPIVLFGTEPFSSALRLSNLSKYKYDWIWDKEQGTNQFMKNKQPLRKHENVSVFYDKQCKFNKVIVNSWRREIKYRQETKYDVIGFESKEKTNYDSKGLKEPVTILPFNRPHWREGKYHNTQKPIKLCNYLIQTYTDKNDIVIDLCYGSGTTAVSCKQLGRNFYGTDNGVCDKKNEFYGKSWKEVAEYRMEGGNDN